MIGHQTLITARMSGHRPTDVWLVCIRAEQRYGQYTHPDAQLEPRAGGHWVGHPEIHIHDHENAGALDLRCVVGLVVHVCAASRERGLQVLRRVAEFSPAKALAAGDWDIVGWKPGMGFKEWEQ